MSAVPTTDPRLRKQRTILSGDVPNPIDPPKGCRFHPRCPRRFAPCDGAEPPLKETAPGHFTACFLF
jgi:oligopeptide/dipeptide ABC transporter ATP-binding protein